MSKKFEIQLNPKGIIELMKSSEMEKFVHEKAKEVADRAGEGFEADIYQGKTRVNASVGAKTPQARMRNNQENTLLKALK